MKRTRLNPVSKKRRDQNVERAKILEAAWGPRPWVCVFKFRPEWKKIFGGECFGEVNGHELVKSVHGGSRVDISNIRPVCNYHNGAIEDYPKVAHELGLMKHFWET